MTKTQARDLAMVAGALFVLAAVLAVPRFMLRELSFDWDAPRPGTLLAQQVSPDSQFIATVTAADTIGRYVFAMNARKTGIVTVRREIVAPVGYHPHIIRLEWVPDGSRVIANVDHDFGSNNLRFGLKRL